LGVEVIALEAKELEIDAGDAGVGGDPRRAVKRDGWSGASERVPPITWTLGD